MPHSRLIQSFKRILQRESLHNASDIEDGTKDSVERLGRRSLEDLGLLAASIEHDIKNPLAVIDMEIHIMLAKFQHNSNVIAHLKRIEKQTQRIFETMNIVSIFRGGEDHFEKYMEKTNINELAYRSVKVVKLEMNCKDIHFRFESRDIITKVYWPALEHAIINILKNAVEAIRESEHRRGLIMIKAKQDKAFITIDIIDNGCGIRDENLDKLTSTFTTKEHLKPNSGIGLYMANRIINLHKGKLEIKSEFSKGTTVSIILPRYS